MSTAKRRRWVAIWNSTFASCRKTGSVKLCETRAFRIANGTVKELDMDALGMLTELQKAYAAEGGQADPEKAALMEGVIADLKAKKAGEQAHVCNKGCGDKCSDLVEKYIPIGGATSFAEFDDFERAQAQEFHVKENSAVFRLIVNNIFDHPEMNLSQKATAVINAATELSTRVKENPDDVEAKSLLDRVKGLFTGRNETEQPKPFDPGEAEGTFVSYKDASGVWRWMIINTNKFKDREDEIFTEASHKEYIAAVERTGEWPELWLWHTPGTRMGQANLVDYVNGFVVHAGEYDPGFEDVAERLSKMKDLGVSHGFVFPEGDEEDKVYDHYRTFELTVCPGRRSANIWGTEFESFTKEVKMGFSDDKRKFFVEALGEERVVALETKLPALEKELEGEGVNFKDLVDDLFPDPAEKKTEEGEGEGSESPADEIPATEEGGDDTTLEGRVAAVEGQLAAIGDSIKELIASNKTMVESIGTQITQRVDEALTGRKSAPSNGSERPTESDKTKIEGDEVEAAKDALDPEESGADKAANPFIEDLLTHGLPKG